MSGTAGATEIPAGDVTIHPSGGNFNPNLTVVVDESAQNGSELETIFTYLISGGPYTGNSISLGGSSETGDGAVTDIQNVCAGGVFSGSGLTDCTGTAGSLVTLDGVQNQDSGTFGSSSLVNVTDDFLLESGLSGTASGGKFTDQFFAVPEPAGVLLMGLGLALGVGARVRRMS